MLQRSGQPRIINKILSQGRLPRPGQSRTMMRMRMMMMIIIIICSQAFFLEWLQRPGQPRIISCFCSEVFFRKVATTRPATHHEHHFLNVFSGKVARPGQPRIISIIRFQERLQRPGQSSIIITKDFLGKVATTRQHTHHEHHMLPKTRPKPREVFLESLQGQAKSRIMIIIIIIICSTFCSGKVATTRPATHHEHHLLQGAFRQRLQRPGQPCIISIICSTVGWDSFRRSCRPRIISISGSKVVRERMQRQGQTRIMSIICSQVSWRKVAKTRPATHHQHHLLSGSFETGCNDQASHASSASFAPRCLGEGCKDQASHASLASFAPRFLWDDQASHASSASFAPWFLRERLQASSASFAPRSFREGLQTPDQPRIISIICSKVFGERLKLPGQPRIMSIILLHSFFRRRLQRPGQPCVISIVCFKVCVVSGEGWTVQAIHAS